MKPPASSTVIKWTDEEWELIAKQLYTTIGTALLSSDTLDEVKAKDVFLAQETALPDNRHRKLISIYQGFQSVREKLKGIFAKAAAAMRQHELFATEQHKIETSSRKQARSVASEAASAHSSTAEESGTSIMSSLDAHASRNQPTIPAGATLPNERLTTQINDPVNKPEVAAATAAPHPDDGRVNAQQNPLLATGTAKPQRPSREAPASTYGRAPRIEQTRPVPDSRVAMPIDLNEMLRPFIAMVAHEFAQALVNVVSKPENRDVLSGMVKNVIGNAGAVNAGNVSHGNAARRTPAQSQSDDRRNLSSAANELAFPNTSVVSQEEDEDAEHDVQPLFDPKLPPSANSSDKPTVGVVGASVRDFDELQQMYPQLQLIAVAVDDVPHAASLGQCQRVIGLREDVPAHTDEQLRHTFRNRYLRLTGGMGRVREQLGAWLDKPGSTGSRRPKFNKPRHNNGQPDGQKKRFNNHPRKPK
ncbi:hypothetical protein [Noviherbaspirillum sp. Root189]|uniref:hypothetical protein n=1 Tax=Noviherbaspirillum sp. Root189 TaxID=1736487 RepID=UPI00070B6697|nr:hypothetical protein [Noviherbaspirillum sp. Root189]KRB74244.1 hypothetical protein ASE07_26725 [Noviherbaspirillum sp. Root189]